MTARVFAAEDAMSRSTYRSDGEVRRYLSRSVWWPASKGEPVTVKSYIELVASPMIRARLGLRDDRGASLVEYALLVALIAVVCILAITFIGNSANDKFSKVGSNLNK